MGFFDFLFSGRPPGVSSTNRQEVESLLQELVEIGHVQDFLSERPCSGFNAHCHNIRARAIGRRLDEIAGMALLNFARERVRRKLGANLAAHLDYAWDEIGEWIA